MVDCAGHWLERAISEDTVFSVPPAALPAPVAVVCAARFTPRVERVGYPPGVAAGPLPERDHNMTTIARGVQAGPNHPLRREAVPHHSTMLLWKFELIRRTRSNIELNWHLGVQASVSSCASYHSSSPTQL